MRWLKFTAAGKTSWGIVEGEHVIAVNGDPFGEWQRGTQSHALKDVKIELPLIPRTFYCVGLNYLKHLKEAADKAGTVPNVPDRPEIGYRAQNALIAHDEDVVIPASATEKIHYEGELVVVIGKKAKTANVAACTVFRQSHVGRLAAYPMMAMREGMIGLATADSGRSPKHVAPFGGREPRLGTNPLDRRALGPRRPLLSGYGDLGRCRRQDRACCRAQRTNPKRLDRRYSRSAHNRPQEYRKGGALLPLGGTEGYKGSGLAAMVEVLCGLLTGLGFGVEPTGRHNDGCFMAVFNVAAFRPLADFKKEVAEFARYLKATPPSEGRPACSIPARSNTSASRSAARRHRGRGRHLGQAARARRRIQDGRRARLT